ncbi:MAG: hypothetical protein WCR04_11980 [Fibrobacteraceae bacterium]
MMSNFLLRFRYGVLSGVALVLVFLIFVKGIVPLSSVLGNEFTQIVVEMQNLKNFSNPSLPSDSLMAHYRELSKKIDTYTDSKITPSEVLKKVLETAQKNHLTLLDLSTREAERDGLGVEYPVSLKAKGGFYALHHFVLDLENGSLCVKVSLIRMELDEAGNLQTSMEFSVFGHEKGGE